MKTGSSSLHRFGHDSSGNDDWFGDDAGAVHSHGPGVEVESPDAIVRDKTIVSWTEDWWRWAVQSPTGSGPLDSSSHQSSDHGGMFFIAGQFDATINAPAGKPILLPMANAFDTEGPNIETLPGYLTRHPGQTYADEAHYVTNLEQNSIYDAFVKITTASGATALDLHWPETSHLAEKTGIFALGAPQSGSWIASALASVLPLDPSIETLPYTRAVGDYAVIDGLKPGVYTLQFGGKAHAVIDPETGTQIFGEGWAPTRNDTLIVGHPCS